MTTIEKKQFEMTVLVISGLFYSSFEFEPYIRLQHDTTHLRMLTESEMNRNIVLLSDSNKITRQKALQSLCNDLKSSLSSNGEDDHSPPPPPNTIESVLKILSDPAEKNRDLALTYISMYVTKYCTDESSLDKALVSIVPSLVQRLGMNDIVEPSEEIRLKAVILLSDLCRVYPNGNRLALYLNEWVAILKRTIVDPYPEVRKLSCELTSRLAVKCHEKFHMMSESLVKPIIETMKHQHAKVRVEAVIALGKFPRPAMATGNSIFFKKAMSSDMETTSPWRTSSLR